MAWPLVKELFLAASLRQIKFFNHSETKDKLPIKQCKIELDAVRLFQPYFLLSCDQRQLHNKGEEGGGGGGGLNMVLACESE